MGVATGQSACGGKNLKVFPAKISGAQSLKAKSMSGLCLSTVEPQKATTARSAFFNFGRP
jgi:hypothetical protein